MNASDLKPVYLLSDSQLLFWKTDGIFFINAILNSFDIQTPVAAYIGASNNDDSCAYQIFEEAMRVSGIRNYYWIRSQIPVQQKALQNANIVFLAGGGVETGWNFFVRSGLKKAITERYYSGAILVGISAGSVQLGLWSWKEECRDCNCIFPVFQLVPFIVGVHEEKQDWINLKKIMKCRDTSGLAIPSGAGIIYHKRYLKSIRYPSLKFFFEGGQLKSTFVPEIKFEEIKR